MANHKISGVFVYGMVVIVLILFEESVRNSFGGTMQIEGLPIENATVNGMWRRDFLWVGKACRIEVSSERPLQLIFDGE